MIRFAKRAPKFNPNHTMPADFVDIGKKRMVYCNQVRNGDIVEGKRRLGFFGMLDWLENWLEENREKRQKIAEEREAEENRKRQKDEERRKQCIWHKYNKQYFSYGGGYGGYETRLDLVRYVAGRFIAESNYDGDSWTESELLPTREDAEKWIVAHKGADDLGKIKWPGEENEQVTE